MSVLSKKDGVVYALQRAVILSDKTNVVVDRHVNDHTFGNIAYRIYCIREDFNIKSSNSLSKWSYFSNPIEMYLEVPHLTKLEPMQFVNLLREGFELRGHRCYLNPQYKELYEHEYIRNFSKREVILKRHFSTDRRSNSIDSRIISSDCKSLKKLGIAPRTAKDIYCKVLQIAGTEGYRRAKEMVRINPMDK